MPRRALLLRPFRRTTSITSAAASFALFVGTIHASNAQDITLTPEPTAGTVETAEPTSSITFGPTPAPTQDDTNNNKQYPTPGVSCKDFTLKDGASTIDIDSRFACFEACDDRHSEEWYFPPYGFDHGKNMGYEYFYSNDNNRVIGLFAECYCYDVHSDDKEYLCGKTRFGEPLPVPEEPLPQCTDMNIHGAWYCSNRCASMYSVNSWDVDSLWTTWRYNTGCTCTLSDDVSFRICTEPAAERSGSSYNDDDYSSLPGGVVAAIIVLFLVGCCAYRSKFADTDVEARRQGRNPDPALSEFRQQQQRRQQAGTAAAAGASLQTQPSPQLSEEEQQRLRRGVVKSNLFSHTLTEGDDVDNLASVVASNAGRSDGDNKDEGEEEEPATRPGGGILDTLRSAVSSIPSVRSAGNPKPECSICLMAYESGETVSWAKEEECDHMYHEDCIVGWLSTPKRDGTLHDSCPLCRIKLIVDEAEA